MGLKIQLVGGVRFLIDDQEVPQLRSRTASALLIYLAYHSQSFSREFLSGLFWPEKTDTQASANLRTSLKLLRPHFSPYLTITRQTIAFNHESLYEIDALKIEALVNQRTENQQQGEETATIETLLPLFKDQIPEFMPGFYIQQAPRFEQWMTQIQSRFQALVETGLEQLAHRLIDFGRYREAIRYAEAYTTLNPNIESMQRLLMEALWRSGRRSEALTIFNSVSERLREELGSLTSPEMDQLYARIKSQTANPATELPIQSTPLIGRHNELEKTYTQLKNPSCRLLTIFGPGGVGKTRLLMALGAKFRGEHPGRFPNGVFFIPLAQLSNAKYLATAIATGLDIPLSGNDSPRQDLLNYLSDKEILLLLDNMEHLLADSEGSDQTLGLVEALIQAAPKSKLCVTSRARLLLKEEWLFRLDGLASPPPDWGQDQQPQPTRTEREYPAINLFLEISRRRAYLFEPRPDELPDVGHICRLLDGLPLGIEMATSLLDDIPVSEIPLRIETQLNNLSLPLRNVPKRHQSLWGLFDYSYQQLNPQLQVTLSKLSIFQAPFTATGAQAVAEATRDDLRQLVNRTLLREIPGEGAIPTRYEMHRLLHRFAHDQLQTDRKSISSAEVNHATYISDFLFTQKANIKRGWPQTLFTEIEASIDDIRAVWLRILGETVDAKAITVGQHHYLERSLDGLFYFYWTRGWLEEGQEMASRLSSLVQSPQLSIKGGLWAAEFDAWLGKYETSAEAFQRTLARCRALALRSIEIDALNGLGRVFYWQGDLSRSETLFEENLRLARLEEDPFAIALALNCLANVVAEAHSDYKKATKLFTESLNISRSVEDLYGSARALINLGTVANKMEHYEEAEALYQESLDLYQRIGYQHGIGFTLNYMGQLASKTGKFELAESLISQSYELHTASGDKRAMADSLRQLGNTARDQANPIKAFKHYREALTLSRSIQGELLTLGILTEIAGLYHKQDEYSLAYTIASYVKRHPLAGQEVIEPAEEVLAKRQADLAQDLVLPASLDEMIALALSKPPQTQ